LWAARRILTAMGYPAPVIRNTDNGRELAMMRWEAHSSAVDVIRKLAPEMLPKPYNRTREATTGSFEIPRLTGGLHLLGRCGAGRLPDVGE
jgi:hypothetical protein